MLACLDFAPGQLPADKPRYLMGVGKPDDLVGAVARGMMALVALNALLLALLAQLPERIPSARFGPGHSHVPFAGRWSPPSQDAIRTGRL